MGQFSVTVPAGASPGDQMTVDLGGQQMSVTVPAGAAPGSSFLVEGPAEPAPVVVAAQPVLAQPVAAQPMAPAVTTVVMAPQHMAPPLQPYEGLKCVATTHLVLECIECVISGICAFIWLMWVAFQSDSFEDSQEAKVHLLIGPWHLIAIGATIAAGGIGCNCVYHDAAGGAQKYATVSGIAAAILVLRIGALASMFEEDHFGNGFIVIWLLWSLALGIFRCIGLLMGCTWSPPQGNAATAP